MFAFYEPYELMVGLFLPGHHTGEQMFNTVSYVAIITVRSVLICAGMIFRNVFNSVFIKSENYSELLKLTK